MGDRTDGIALCMHYRRLKRDCRVPHSAAPVTKDEDETEADPATQKVQDNKFIVDGAKDEDEEGADPATQEVEDNDLVVDTMKHEENKETGPATQEVEDNDFIVDVTKDEDEKKAGPVMQEVQDKAFMVGAAKHEENNKADPATQKVHENDFIVGADPGNTNIITIAAPKRAGDGADGNLRQKDMHLLRFSRARHYRESGIMNARKKTETWKAGIKDHPEALSEATSRGADFEAFRKFVEVRVAHWDALWEAYTKPQWARLRMNLYGGKQRAFANFFNQLSA